MTVLTRKAAHVEGAEDLNIKLQVPGQPREVAVLAEELDGMLVRLDEAVAARETALLAARRFAADAEHELRTPLQSVRANLACRKLPSQPDLVGARVSATAAAC